MSFFYNVIGDKMKIYLDLLFLLNFSFDFLLLLSVAILLRRNVKISRMVLGAVVGSLSIFILFLNTNSIQLFIIKLLISIIMILVSFGYKNIYYTFKNFIFLYLVSIVLGGFLYYLNLEFSYKNEGIIFYHHGLSINYIFLVIISPIILYIYVRQGKGLKNLYNNYYNIELYLNENDKLDLTAFLDTGNTLKDPYKKRPVILINKNKINNIENYKFCFVNYSGINDNGILKCITVYQIKINDKIVKNFLVGLLEEDIKIDGVDCILHPKIMEGI